MTDAAYEYTQTTDFGRVQELAAAGWILHTPVPGGEVILYVLERPAGAPAAAPDHGPDDEYYADEVPT